MTDSVRLQTRATPGHGIEVLTPEAVQELRIPWDARYSKQEILDLVASEPDLSLWHPRTGGFLLASRWRHRDEIANVLDITGPAVSHELLRSFVDNATDAGFLLAVVAEYSERRSSSFYDAAGLQIVENIVVYELGRISRRSGIEDHLDRLRSRIVDVLDNSSLQQLLELDHAAFPWLWWNSSEEFLNYAAVPGVAIEAFDDDDGQPIGYIGTTSLGSWGHLDRIAVAPMRQGEGLGRRLLNYAIGRLSNGGARRIALSTQATNHVSRALYESMGFRRSRRHDYRIYGRSLRDDLETV